MLTPERFNILQWAFEKAKYSGLHDNVYPPPMINLASGLVGLITHKDIATSIHKSQKINYSFSRMLPPHIITALQKWALVTKEKMAPPLCRSVITHDHDPTFPQYWIEHPRDKAFGANCNAFSSKFTDSLFVIPFFKKHHVFRNKA